MSRSSRIFSVVFGTALVLLGLVIFLSGSISLPLRRAPPVLRFRGFSLLLLALSPAACGSAFLGLGSGVVERDSRAIQLIVGAAIASICLALVVASLTDADSD